MTYSHNTTDFALAGDGRAVLVAPAGNVDNDDLIPAHGRGQLSGVGHGMGGFDGGNNALHAAEILKGIHGLRVGDGDVFRPSDVMEMGVLRPDAGVIKAGGNGIHRRDLAELILTEIALHAVENTRPPGGDGGRRFGGVPPPALPPHSR